MTDSNGAPVDGPRQPSRLEAEVAEILARTEQPASFTDHVRRKTEAAGSRARPTLPAISSLNQLGPGSFLLGALVFAVLGAAVSGASPFLGTILGIVSVVSLVMVWVRRTPPGFNRTKTWRGRDLGPNPGAPPWVDNLRDWFRRPPR